jgi:hypothetical protein
MKKGSDRNHRFCVENFGFNYDEIKACAQSDFAVQQQLEFEKFTSSVLFETNWVPTVLYNGKITKYSHTGTSPALSDVFCEFFFAMPVCKSNNLLKTILKHTVD